MDAAQKKENEKLIEEISQKMRKKAQQRPEGEEERTQWEYELEQELKGVLEKEKILCLSEWMGGELLDAFERETKNFIGKVRGFDEALKPEQIWPGHAQLFYLWDDCGDAGRRAECGRSHPGVQSALSVYR